MTEKQIIDFYNAFGHFPKGVKISVPSLSQAQEAYDKGSTPKMEIDPCESSKEWFESYLKDYVKEASVVDLFEKLRNVTKTEYHPLVEELHSRYGDKVIELICKSDLQADNDKSEQ